MKIIFIRNDLRSSYEVKKQEKVVLENITPVYQVYKKTFRNYKPGDFLSLKLDMKPYAFGGGIFYKKIHYLTENVLAQVKQINNNVVVVDIVK